MAYIGKNLVGVLNEGRTVDTMTGDNSTTTLALSRTPGSMNNVLVFIDGIRQTPDTDYTLSGSTLTFTTAPETGVSVSVISGNDTPIVPDKGSVSATKLVDGSITDSKIVGMSSSKLSGALPALDGSALTGFSSYTVIAADPTITTNPADGVGSLYVNSTSGEVYICTDATTDNNVWTNVGGGEDNVVPINLYAWGQSTHGRLGMPAPLTTPGHSNPASQEYRQSVPVAIGSDFAKLGNDMSSASFGIKKDGTLWVWGKADLGSSGLGGASLYNFQSNTPVQVGTDTDWAEVCPGGAHTVARKTNGTLWTCGRNNNGQLGTNNTTDYNIFTQVGSNTDWSKIWAEGNASSAITTDGKLFTWGAYAQGGRNNQTVESSPVQVGGAEWSKTTLGASFSLAVKLDGTLWSWGGNSDGQLGIGNTTSTSSPVQIGSDTNWTDCESSNSASFAHAIKSDGTLWAWGWNYQGALGVGNNTNKFSSPVQVGTDTNWLNAKVSHGNAPSAVKADGSLWVWGKVWEGRIGDGYATYPNHQFSPKRLGIESNWVDTKSNKYSGVFGLKS